MERQAFISKQRKLAYYKLFNSIPHSEDLNLDLY